MGRRRRRVLRQQFFVDEARVLEFAERILDLGIGWWAEGRVDTLLRYSERTWTLLRDSGLRMVFMGAESGSDATLRRMNKGRTAATEKTLAVAERAARFGIVPEFSFVVGNPPDPEEDIQQTFEFIRRVKRANPHSEIVIYTYTPVPLAGDLYEQAKAKGFEFPSSLDQWARPDWQAFSQRRRAHLPWLKVKVRRQVRDFERVLNAYYPTTTNPRLRGHPSLLLGAASAWRYRSRSYRYSWELRALHRFFGYERPETTGF